MIRFSKYKKGSAGFTVLEAIIAFAMLTLALAGFTGMIVTSIRGFRASQERYVATAIAQEGMELAQNKKDNHVQCVAADPTCVLSNWQDNLLGSFEVEASRINDLRPVGQFASFDSTRYLCIMTEPPTDAGKFGYCGTPFYLSARYTREVEISSISSHAVSVKTTVRWGANKSLELQSVLFSDL